MKLHLHQIVSAIGAVFATACIMVAASAPATSAAAAAYGTLA